MVAVGVLETGLRVVLSPDDAPVLIPLNDPWQTYTIRHSEPHEPIINTKLQPRRSKKRRRNWSLP